MSARRSARDSGGPPTDPDALTDESPAHRVRLPRFWLARYPVTVGQWRVYYEAVEIGAWVPRRPDGEPSELLDPRSVVGVATHPVVWVSWYDAMDYGRWLTTQLRARADAERRRAERDRVVPAVLAQLLLEGDAPSGGRRWVITLPSEAEWERGARGPAAAWRYPWGDTWDPNRTNGWPEDDTAIQGTTAVGIYPGGASPGCGKRGWRKAAGSTARSEEQSGNVWEWTRSLWGTDDPGPYPYEPDYDGLSCEDVRTGEDVDRVFRGGSFSYSPGELRSAIRYYNHPRRRDPNLGFRVVASPFALAL